jgi:hypothetical protein
MDTTWYIHLRLVRIRTCIGHRHDSSCVELGSERGDSVFLSIDIKTGQLTFSVCRISSANGLPHIDIPPFPVPI